MDGQIQIIQYHFSVKRFGDMFKINQWLFTQLSILLCICPAVTLPPAVFPFYMNRSVGFYGFTAALF